MTPIINPWLFYLMSIANGLVGIWLILLISSLIVVGFSAGFGWIDDEDSGKEFFKRTWFYPIIFSLLIVFTPGESTITKMIIAQNVTYERVDKALATGKVLKDELKKDVIDIITTIKDKEKEK